MTSDNGHTVKSEFALTTGGKALLAFIQKYMPDIDPAQIKEWDGGAAFEMLFIMRVKGTPMSDAAMRQEAHETTEAVAAGFKQLSAAGKVEWDEASQTWHTLNWLTPTGEK